MGELETHVRNAFQFIHTHAVPNVNFVTASQWKLFGSLIEKLVVEKVGGGLSEPLPLFVGKHAFHCVYRLFAIREFHFNVKEDIAECIILAVAHIKVKVVQLNGVVRFEFEMNRLNSAPSLWIDGLVALEFTGRFARYQARCGNYEYP